VTLLFLVSITDVKFAAQKMFEFDKVLLEMGVQSFSLAEEQAAMATLTKKLKKKFYDEDEVYHRAPEPSKVYSNDPQI
jgi:hypothetical protein